MERSYTPHPSASSTGGGLVGGASRSRRMGGRRPRRLRSSSSHACWTSALAGACSAAKRHAALALPIRPSASQLFAARSHCLTASSSRPSLLRHAPSRTLCCTSPGSCSTSACRSGNARSHSQARTLRATSSFVVRNCVPCPAPRPTPCRATSSEPSPPEHDGLHEPRQGWGVGKRAFEHSLEGDGPPPGGTESPTVGKRNGKRLNRVRRRCRLRQAPSPCRRCPCARRLLRARRSNRRGARPDR